MKKMEAIRTANNAVNYPVGRTGHWAVYGPYRAHDPDGDVTSIVRPTYAEALSVRREWVAKIALVLMGYDAELVQEALYLCDGRLEKRINDAIIKLEAMRDA